MDEDEQDGVPDDDYMNQFGGGMPDMGMGDGGFGGLDFSKLGGGAGGMPDFSGLGGAGDEEEDEDMDMPGLEDEAEKPATGHQAAESGESSGSRKIEEVE